MVIAKEDLFITASGQVELPAESKNYYLLTAEYLSNFNGKYVTIESIVPYGTEVPDFYVLCASGTKDFVGIADNTYIDYWTLT